MISLHDSNRAKVWLALNSFNLRRFSIYPAGFSGRHARIPDNHARILSNHATTPDNHARIPGNHARILSNHAYK